MNAGKHERLLMACRGRYAAAHDYHATDWGPGSNNGGEPCLERRRSAERDKNWAALVDRPLVISLTGRKTRIRSIHYIHRWVWWWWWWWWWWWLPEPMLPYCQLAPAEHFSVKFYLKFTIFRSRKCIRNVVCEMAAILSRSQCVTPIISYIICALTFIVYQQQQIIKKRFGWHVLARSLIIETISAFRPASNPGRSNENPIWWRWHGNTKSLSNLQCCDV